MEIYHSAKGTTWKDHKYVRKEGNRYIYKLSDSFAISSDSRRDLENYKTRQEDLSKLDKEFVGNELVDEKEWRKEARNYNTAVTNKRIGGNGMPSSVANALAKAAQTRMSKIVRDYAVIKADADQKNKK